MALHLVNKMLLKHSPPTCSHPYGCFCPATAEFKSCDRAQGGLRNTIYRKNLASPGLVKGVQVVYRIKRGLDTWLRETDRNQNRIPREHSPPPSQHQGTAAFTGFEGHFPQSPSFLLHWLGACVEPVSGLAYSTVLTGAARHPQTQTVPPKGTEPFQGPITPWTLTSRQNTSCFSDPQWSHLPLAWTILYCSRH